VNCEDFSKEFSMIFRSAYPDLTIPVMPLSEFVLQRAPQFAEKPAYIDGLSGRKITFRQLAEGARLIAGNLNRRGFNKGEVFAIYSPNVPEYALAFHGAVTAGGIVTTADPLSNAQELTHQLNDAKAKYLVTTSDFLDQAILAAGQSGVREIFTFDETRGATPFRSLLEIQRDAHRSTTGPTRPADRVDPRNDVCLLPYSSGASDLPKGVMRTHYSYVANILQSTAVDSIAADDTLIGVIPMFHSYGIMALLNYAPYLGVTVVTLPRFSLEQFLQTMQDYRVTRAHLLPPILLALAKQAIVGRYDLSSLKVIYTGAAPQDENCAWECEKRLKCLDKQGYGMTEAGPLVLYNADENPETRRLNSVGFLPPNSEGKIISGGTGAELGVNQPGELCVRGPHLMQGYLNQPEETAQTIDDEGWLHTGDMAHVDQHGRFYFVDRIKELIKYKALQIAPAELESVLLAHPAVLDVAVIGSPDEDAGEAPKAFVVRKSEDVTVEALMRFVAERVAPHKKIRRIEFIESIPKSPSGKILRRLLIERERNALNLLSHRAQGNH
jgi:acyl-CoA synthetase (AMP-forming)/AMP-acid ligase II